MGEGVRFARFQTGDGRSGFGALEEDRILEYTGSMFDSPRATGTFLRLDTCRLLAPVTPSKIIALWNNFHQLAAKMGKQPPTTPLFLIKPASCIAGPDDAIERPVGYAGKIVFEGELGIVIGRRCKNVSIADAPGFIFGYTAVNDVTAADVLNETPDFAQWCRSKSYDTFGCIGPAIATQLDLGPLRVITRLDGAERQNYAVSDMIFPPAELVSKLSHDLTLLPGDIIACGTSLGVGSIREGFPVEISIDGVGTLRNALRA